MGKKKQATKLPLVPSADPPQAADVLSVHSVAVGHGDATLLVLQEADGTRWSMLVDGGPRGSGDRLKESLRAHGVDRLDVIVLTHVDGDHVDGLLELAGSRFPVREYWGPCIRAFERHRWLFGGQVIAAIEKARRLEELLVREGTRVRYPTEGFEDRSQDGRRSVLVLSPAARLLERLLLTDDVSELFATVPHAPGLAA